MKLNDPKPRVKDPKPRVKDPKPNPVEEGWEILKRAASHSLQLTDPDPDEILAEMQEFLSEKDF